MPGFMDKVKQAAGGVADATKKGAATAQTKAKIHGLRNKADEGAQKLGYLVYRERSGGEAAGAEADELVKQTRRSRSRSPSSGLSPRKAARRRWGSRRPPPTNRA